MISIKVTALTNVLNRKFETLKAEVQADINDSVLEYGNQFVEHVQRILRGEIIADRYIERRTGNLHDSINFEFLGEGKGVVLSPPVHSPRGADYSHLQHEGFTHISAGPIPGVHWMKDGIDKIYPLFLADLYKKKQGWNV